MNLKGKKVLITGSAVRVGAYLAEEFFKLGAELILHYRNSKDYAENLAKKLNNAKIVYGDFSTQEQVLAFWQEIGSVDILINNASIYDRKGLEQESLKDQELQMQVNYYAPLTLMKLFAKQNLLEGAIINIIDCEINLNNAQYGSYSIAKRCLKEATKSLALEVAKKNIRVNAVAPGPMLPPAFLPNSKMEENKKNLPLKRVVELSDFAQAVIFLAQNNSITGEILTIDCGYSLKPF